MKAPFQVGEPVVHVSIDESKIKDNRKMKPGYVTWITEIMSDNHPDLMFQDPRWVNLFEKHGAVKVWGESQERFLLSLGYRKYEPPKPEESEKETTKPVDALSS